MLTIRAMSDGTGYAGKYLVQSDYHSEKGRIKGLWFGKGAEKLGLTGEVKLEDFEAVRQQLDPNMGEKLRQRVSADRHDEDGKLQSRGRNLYDFTFSAPKSISVMAFVGGDERLIEAHRIAVKEALTELETVAAARVRTNGANHDRTTGNLVVACYDHDTSRELDPQLHTHAVAANLTFDEAEGRWKALQARPMYEQRGFLTEVYRNALMREALRLGYTRETISEEDGHKLTFEIQGLSPELLKKFSQRSDQRDQAIAEFTEREGRKPTNNEIAILVRESRQDKLTDISPTEVRQRQQARLTDEDRHELHVTRRQAEILGPWPVTDFDSLDLAQKSLNYGLRHVFERVSVAFDHEVLETALEHGNGFVHLKDLRSCLKVKEAHEEILRAGTEIATRESLDRETAMIGLVNDKLGAHERLGGKRTFDPYKNLSPEQNEAVQFVLDSRDFAVSVQGAAGTGKTALLTALRRELAHGGRLTIEVAPTKSAVEELHKVGFEEAMTIERLLQDKEAQSFLRGRVLIVDEAGMVSGRQMHDLLALSKEQNARIAFSGDTSQLQSVEAGDALRVLEDESLIKTISLTQVKRQQNQAYREAIETLREDPQAGLDKLVEMNAVVVTTPEDRPKEVARAYAAAKGETIVVCPTHAEVDRVTYEIRELQRAQGNLGEGTIVERLEPLNWTVAQKGEPQNFEPGMVLVFHKNTKDALRHQSFEVVDVQNGKVMAKDERGRTAEFSCKQAQAFAVFQKAAIEVATGDKLILMENRRGDLSTTNGERVTIDRVDSDGFIHLNDGRTLPKDYQQFDHGWAITSHRSQGKTVDNVIVSGNSMSKELFYVAASRGRETVQVFTSDPGLLEESIARSAARQSATEFAARMVAMQVANQVHLQHQATTVAQQQISQTGPSQNAPAPSQAPGQSQSQSQSQAQGPSHDR